MDIGKLKLQVDYGDVEKAAKKLGDLGGVAASSVPKFAAVAKGVGLIATAAIATVTGLVALARSVADAADAMNDLSVRTNISTERLSLLDAIAKTAGSSIEELVASSERLGQKLARQDEETGKVVKALRELGVSTKTATGEAKSLLQIQEDVVKATDAAGNSAKAEGNAVQILGQEYFKLRGPIREVLEKKKEMYEYMKKVGSLTTTQLAKDSDELNDKLGKLGLAFEGMGKSIASAVIPVLNVVLDKIIEIAAAAADVIRRYTGNRTNQEFANDATEGLRQRLTIQEGLLERAKEAASRTGDNKQVIRIQAQVDKLKESVRAMDLFKTATEAANAAVDNLVISGRPGEGNAVTGTTDTADKEREAAAKKAAAERQRLIELGMKGEVALAEFMIEQNEKEVQATADAAIAKLEIEKKNQADITKWHVEEAQRRIDADFEATQKLAEMQIKQAEQHFTVMQKIGEQAFQSIGNALMDFVVQGEFNFKKFLAAFLRGIAQMIMQITILTPLMEAFKKSFSSTGGGWGSLVTNIVGAFAGGKAAGGPVGAGKTYMVGEKGPELFTPNSNGNIVPNHQLRSGAGSGVQVGSINISVQGGQTNEETGSAVSKAVLDAMKGIARTEIASSRRVGGILNPV